MSASRRGLTAAGRLTAWYAVLFTVGASLMALGSYGLVRRTFDRSIATDPFEELAARGVSPDAVARVRDALGVDPRTFLADSVSRAQRQLLDEMLVRSAVSLVVTVALSVLGALWLARRTLRPVGRLTTLAQDISVANLHDRIDLQGPNDELKRLADTFDGMLARLEQAFVAQRLFAAHVSHELRTPLATLRAEADLVAGRDDASERERTLALATQATVARADHLIGGLLALSRAESGTADRERVDLAELVGDAVAEQAAAADGAGVTMELVLDDAHLAGDRVLLRSLVDNVLRNAVAYNVEGGDVAVSVTTVADRVRLTVANRGRTLTAAEVAAFTRPFVRGDADRPVPGSGIGTAVVQAVTAAHHGTVAAAPRPGGGLVVTVELPAAT